MSILLNTARKNLKLRPISDEIRELMLQLGSDEAIEREKAQALLLEKRDKVLDACETDSHIALLESFDHHYHEMALELTAQFIAENDCRTVAEKMQAEIIIGYFIRILECSRKLNGAFDPYWMPSKERNKLITLLMKQVDLATRHFHASLALFRQWRMPAISLNIKTNNAFVAQNVQR